MRHPSSRLCMLCVWATVVALSSRSMAFAQTSTAAPRHPLDPLTAGGHAVHHGIEHPGRQQRAVGAERRLLLGSSSWPGGIPAEVAKAGDAPAGVAAGVTPTVIGQGVPVQITRRKPFEQLDDTNVVRGAAKGTVSAIAYARLGDVTSEQFRALAAIQRELGEGDDQTKEIEELRTKIEAAGMPETVKKEALRELDRLSKMPVAAAEYTVSRTYLDWIVALPWS